MASYGANSKDGIQLAATEINQAFSEGKSKFKVSLSIEDSKGEPQQAVSSLQKLISVDHVAAIIGDVGSSATLAMAPIANANKVVIMSPAASAPAISTAGVCDQVNCETNIW